MGKYDLELWAKQIKQTLIYHDKTNKFEVGINEKHIVSMLEIWEKNKKNLVENLLDGQLQIKIPIDSNKFKIVDYQKIADSYLSARACKTQNRIKRKYYEGLTSISSELLQKILDNKSLDLESYDSLWFMNIFLQINMVHYSFEYNRVREKIRQDLEKNKSPKLSKQIKFMMELYERPENEIKDALSVLSEIQGLDFGKNEFDYLVLSVHPLDYITQSVNDYSWMSCTNPNNGYFVSALSGMQDKSTMVCFMEGQKSKLVLYKEGEDNVYWNNKKIRALLFASPDLGQIIINQTYPRAEYLYFNEVIAEYFKNKKYSLQNATSIFYEAERQGWYHSTIDNHPLFYLDRPHDRSLLIREDKIKDRDPLFLVGEDVLCLVCGEIIEEEPSIVGSYCPDCLWLRANKSYANYFEDWDEYGDYYDDNDDEVEDKKISKIQIDLDSDKSYQKRVERYRVFMENRPGMIERMHKTVINSIISRFV